MALLSRTRLRRVEKRGGHPLTRGWPWRQREVVPFAPEPLDEAEHRKTVEREVSGLLPYALDEANGGALDRWIDSWAARWIDDIDAAYSAYLSVLAHEIGGANATLQELSRLRDQDLRELAEANAAREVTFETLTGRTYPSTAERAPFALPPVEPLFRPTEEAPPPDHHAPEKAWAEGARLEETRGQAPRPAVGEPDYAEPGLVGGRPRSSYLHVGALVVAAVADFGAFSQVVQLVMRSQGAWLVYLVVGGFTAAALYLAHAAGTSMRDLVAGVRSARWWLPASAALAWTALGSGSAYVRYTVSPVSPAGTGPVLVGGAPQVAAPTDPTGPNALLFLGLFIGTGLVAALGAYATHNPAREAYGRIRSRCSALYEQLAASAAAVEKAITDRADQYRLRDEATVVRDRERHRRTETAHDLKQYARVLVAQHHQDPAFTDALFDPERPGRDRPAAGSP